jgi:2'-5' RNA ligase
MNDEPHAPVRVFFALWPGEAGRAALAAWQPPLRKLCGGRTMQAENLHNTLVFLGNVAEHRLEALKLAAQEVEARRFDLRIDQARYWGHNHIVFAAPHVVPPKLAQLVHDLEQSLERHRFRFDRRDYKPHITLLRHAKWSDEPLPKMPIVSWQVRDFVLVQSPQPGGDSRYRVIARFPLRAGS